MRRTSGEERVEVFGGSDEDENFHRFVVDSSFMVVEIVIEIDVDIDIDIDKHDTQSTKNDFV